MWRWISILWLVMGSGVIHAQELPDTEASVTVITNGQLIDGTGTAPIAIGTVVVEGERIVAVGAADDVDIPDDATIIDAGGGTILPGIINAHTHRATSSRNRYTLFTQRGVTAICDMGSAMIALSQLDDTVLRGGTFAGRAGRSGPFITVEGGYPGPIHGDTLNYTIAEAGSPADAVATLQSEGATYIKIGLEPTRNNLPMLAPTQVTQIVSAAHERDMLVHAHVQVAAQLAPLLDAGVDVLHHVPVPITELQRERANTLRGLLSNDDIALPESLLVQLERAVASDVLLVPTLDVLVPADDETNQLAQWYGRLVQAVVREYIAQGGRVAVGNDYGNPGVRGGMPVREMQLLHDAGLTRLEVLTAATYHAAHVCDMGEDIGTLEPNKFADIVVVDGNPLEDLAVMDDLTFIIANGEPIQIRSLRRR